MGYSTGLSFYIDVLGTMNRSFDELLKINTIFREELKEVKERENPKSHMKRFFTSFSDCAYLIYVIKDEYIGDEDIKISCIYKSLYNTASTICYFVINGFLVRGGVYFGELYFNGKDNTVFGPAINNSYLLESTGKMPRIVIDDELAKIILDYDEKVKTKNIQARMLNGNIILKDEVDGKYYLNYLNYLTGVGTVELKNGTYTFNTYYEKAKQFSEEAINSARDYGVIAKHNWQINYLNSIKKYNESMPEMDTNEFMKIMLMGAGLKIVD